MDFGGTSALLPSEVTAGSTVGASSLSSLTANTYRQNKQRPVSKKDKSRKVNPSDSDSDSSEEEGELSDSNDESQTNPTNSEAPPSSVPSKGRRQLLWANVMLDQTVDDIVTGVNAHEGTASNRSVESYCHQHRPARISENQSRKRGRQDEEDEPVEAKTESGNAVPEMETSVSMSVCNEEPSAKRGRRMQVVYDDEDGSTAPQEAVDSIPADRNDNTAGACSSKDSNGKDSSKKKIIGEMDVSMDDVITESCAFLARAKDKHRRPRKPNDKDGVVIGVEEKNKRAVALIEYLKWLLNEKNVDLLERLVGMKSQAFVMYQVDKTIQTEQEGGILTNSGIRKRLPGGVFISVLKTNLNMYEKFVILEGKTQTEAKQICDRIVKKKNAKRNAKKENEKKREVELFNDDIVQQALDFDASEEQLLTSSSSVEPDAASSTTVKDQIDTDSIVIHKCEELGEDRSLLNPSMEQE